MTDPFLIMMLLILGAGAGFAAGLLGIGGGMVMVPFLTFIFTHQHLAPEHIVHIAIATSLASILFTSVSSVRAHHQRGAVRWPIVIKLAPGILLGSLIGARLAGSLNTFWVALIFVVFVVFSATQMLINRRPKASRELPGVLGMTSTGTAIGFLSSMVGAGGGFISVPFMTWCNVSIHHAIATSAALGFPIALAGTLGYIFAGLNAVGLPNSGFMQSGMLGFIYVPALLAVSIASILTAPLGAKAAHQLNTVQLKRVFAFMLYALAAYMSTKIYPSYPKILSCERSCGRITALQSLDGVNDPSTFCALHCIPQSSLANPVPSGTKGI